MSSGGSMSKQIGKKQNGITNHKQRATALERLELLEAQMQVLAKNLQGIFNNLTEEHTNTNRVLAAATEIIGRQAVQDKAKEMRITELETQADQNDKNMEESVKMGTVKPIDEVIDSETVVVVVQEKDKEGNTKYPTRSYSNLAAFEDKIKASLIGKKPGDVLTVEDSDGVTLTLLKVYDVVPPPPPTQQEATPTPPVAN